MKKKRTQRRPARGSAAGKSAKTRTASKSTPDTGQLTWRWHLMVAALWTLPALFFMTALRDSFRLPKLVLSELLAVVVLLALVSGLRQRDRVDWRGALKHPAVLTLAPLLLAALLSWATTDHGTTTRQALISLWIGGCLAIGLAMGVRPDRLRQSLPWLAVPATLLALIGIGQYFDIVHLFEFRDVLKDRIRLTSLAGGAFDLAAYLVLPALIAQVEWFRPRKPETARRWKIVWGLFLALAVLTLGLTRTLSAVAALVVGSLVLWACLLPRRKLLGVSAGLTLVAVLLGLGITPLRDRLEGKLDDLKTGNLNRLLTGRLDGWRAALWMVEEKPLLGVGHGAYRCEFGDAKLDLRENGVDFYRRQHQPYFVNAHNEVLEAIAEWGLVGALALLAALAMLARQLAQLWRRLRQSAPSGTEGDEDATHSGSSPPGVSLHRFDAALIFAGLAALAVMALTNFPLRLALVAYPYLVLLAGLWAWLAKPAQDAATEATPQDAGAETDTGPDRRVRGVVLLAILAPVLLLALVARGQEGLQRMRASQIVGQVERLTLQLQGSGQLSRPNPGVGRALDAGIEALKRGRKDDPAEVSLPVAQAALYRLLGRPRAALRAYEQGLTIESRPEIHQHVGHTLWSLGEEDAAREAFHRAVMLDHKLAWELRVYLPDLEEAWGRRHPRRNRAQEKPLFSNSFESGDTSGWSRVGDGEQESAEKEPTETESAETEPTEAGSTATGETEDG